MAKIYETQTDRDRDVLARKASDLRDVQDTALIVGFLAGAYGSAQLRVYELSEKLLSSAEKIKIPNAKFDLISGWISVAVGVASIASSLFIRHRAKKTEEELKELGYENVVRLWEREQTSSQASLENTQHVARLEKSRDVVMQESPSR